MLGHHCLSSATQEKQLWESHARCKHMIPHENIGCCGKGYLTLAGLAMLVGNWSECIRNADMAGGRGDVGFCPKPDLTVVQEQPQKIMIT